MIHSVFDPIIVGKIVGAYGIKGWIKIISFTEKSNNIFKYNPWFILFQYKWRPLYLESWKLMNKGYVVKIIDIADRDYAISLIQHTLVVSSDQFPVLENNNEYYWKDIIGCEVITISKQSLGYVVSIIETIAHDVLVIRFYNNKNIINQMKDCLIPFVQDRIIKNVDLNKNIIVVDWKINNF